MEGLNLERPSPVELFFPARCCVCDTGRSFLSHLTRYSMLSAADTPPNLWVILWQPRKMSELNLNSKWIAKANLLSLHPPGYPGQTSIPS